MARASVPEARRAARRLLAWLGYAGDRPAALVMVSELVTNAVVHGAGSPGPLLLRLKVDGLSHLTVEVSDHAPGEPRLPATPAPVDAESGRGLSLVEALGAYVTWEADGQGGKCVRAFLPGARGEG